jgi:hypothetical protein
MKWHPGYWHYSTSEVKDILHGFWNDSSDSFEWVLGKFLYFLTITSIIIGFPLALFLMYIDWRRIRKLYAEVFVEKL